MHTTLYNSVYTAVETLYKIILHDQTGYTQKMYQKNNQSLNSESNQSIITGHITLYEVFLQWYQSLHTLI